MYILITILTSFLGTILGYVAKGIFSRRRPVGAIVVSTDEDKLVYSLELYDDPEKLQYEKEVLFKIETSSD